MIDLPPVPPLLLPQPVADHHASLGAVPHWIYHSPYRPFWFASDHTLREDLATTDFDAVRTYERYAVTLGQLPPERLSKWNLVQVHPLERPYAVAPLPPDAILPEVADLTVLAYLPAAEWLILGALPVLWPRPICSSLTFAYHHAHSPWHLGFGAERAEAADAACQAIADGAAHAHPAALCQVQALLAQNRVGLNLAHSMGWAI